MQFLEIQQFCLATLISDNQYNLFEAKAVEITHNNRKPQDGEIPTFLVFLAPVCFMIVGVAFWVIISKILKITQNKHGTSNIDRLNQYPCRNCKFFDDNNYIKCAVKPSVVLTKQARDCPEYQSADRKNLA
ncbi:MAG: hypothetical protein RMX96_19825 [Nostoc sp. ChiSLP02]|nr:hypothetical protein [Nostoc sp. DedSLP05]MDZ8097494.1 hypothetical protein [Nostoc sp. DedSLP01]MDZ8187083.1 hypothetical protein [Nostoc sp. ChiSLP02]